MLSIPKVFANSWSAISTASRSVTGMVAAATVGLLLLNSHTAQGQTQINWINANQITGNSDVLNGGVSQYAYAWSNSTNTVNGITFTGTASATGGGLNVTIIATPGSGGTLNQNSTAFAGAAAPPANPWNSLSTAYQNILHGAAYTSGATQDTIFLNNLTIGHVYATQFWVNDPRAGEATSRFLYIGGSVNAQQQALNYGGVTPATNNPGMYSVGEFAATTTSQSFLITGNASTQVNALQVLDVTGVWNGFTSQTLNTADANFSAVSTANGGPGANSYSTISTLATPVTSLYFADTDGFGSALPNNSSGNIAINVQSGGFSTGSITFTNNIVNYTFASPDSHGISGTTKINVTGTANVTFTGTQSYTGATTIASGSLILGTGSGAALGNTAVNVASGSANASLVVNGSSTIGTLTSGAGSLTIGASTGIGSLTFPNTEASTSTLTVNNAAANTAITLGNTTTGGTALLNFNASNSSVDLLTTPGVLLVQSGGGQINLAALSGTRLINGTYNLINFGSATNAAGLLLGTTPTGTSSVFYLTTTPTAIVLNVATLSPGQLVWNPSAVISGNANVFNLGSTLAAFNWNNSTQTVNGVTFTGTNSATGGGTAITFSTGLSNTTAVYTATVAPFTSLSAAYQAMLSGAVSNSGATVTVTLNGLTSGHVYSTQFFVEDPRTNGAGRSDTVVGTTNAARLVFNSTQAAGGVGQYALGRFIANAATQSFTVTSAGGVTQINALQFRDVTGVWSGIASANLNNTDLNFTGSNSYSTVSGLGVTALSFGDTDGFANPITNSNLTVQTGGFSTGSMTFLNNNVAYTLTSQDSNGISGATAINLGGATGTSTGSVTLVGTHSYTGATTVASGALSFGLAGSGIGATLGNTAVNVAATTAAATLVLNGSSTIGSTAGSLTIGASTGVGTLTFATTEPATSTLTINNSAANTALTLGGATAGTAVLNFNAGSSSVDQITTTGKISVGAGGAIINLAALNGASLGIGTYNLINYAPSTVPIGLSIGTTLTNLGTPAFVYLTESSTAVTLNVANIPATAGNVSWSTPIVISGVTDVTKVGTSVYAYNWSGTTETINGVTFTGTTSATSGGANITIASLATGTAAAGTLNQNSTAYGSVAAAPYNTLPAAYQVMLEGGAWNGSNPAFDNITLNNLTPGRAYLIQFFVGDDRPGEATRFEYLYTGNINNSTGPFVQLNYATPINSTVGGGVGMYAIGGFLAAASTQTFNVLGNASTQMNAIQVRDVTGAWSGAVSGNLNATDANFTGGNTYAIVSSLTQTLTFGDTDGFGNPVINSSITVPVGGIATGSLVFVNNNVNYTFTSADSKGISGVTSVSLTGTGSVTFTNSNTYTGATTITSGTLILGSGATLGNTAVTVANSTTNAQLQINGNVTIGTASSGTGSLTVGGSTGIGTLSFLSTESAPSTLTINNVATNTALTLGGASGTLSAVLNFNTSNSGVDQIVTAGKLTSGAGGAVINLSALSGTTLPIGSYTLMSFGTSTAPGGFILGTTPAGNPNLFQLSASTTAEKLNVVAATTAGLLKWNAPQTISGNSDVYIGGAFAYAFNWNTISATQTVNGVTFTGSTATSGGGTAITFTGSFGAVIANAQTFTSTSTPFSNLSTAYQGVLSGADLTSASATSTTPTGSVITVTLNSLTSSHAYAAEVWVENPLGLAGPSRTENIAGGNGVTLSVNSATAGALGQYILGGFIANGTTQQFTVTGGTGAIAQINAIEVRDVTGVWSGAASGNLSATAANFTGGNSFNTVSGLGVSTLYFADTDGFGNAIANKSVTVQSGGISTGAIVFQNNNVNYTFNSADANGISGGTTISLTGAGSVTFAGPNTYTGATTVGSGTLILGSGSGASLGNTAVNVATSTTAASLQISGNSTIGTASLGTGSLTIGGSTGVGSLTFVNTESAPSTLNINNNPVSSALNLGGASGITAVLNFNTGNSGVDEIVTPGKLNVGAGGVLINLTGLSGTTLAVGKYTLISFGTSTVPTGFVLGTTPAGNPSLLYLTSTSTAEVLNVFAAPASAFWTGSQSSVWSTNLGGAGTSNWVTTAGGATDSGVPGGGTNVTFTANSSTVLSTSLGLNLAINSLNISGTGTPAAAGIAIGGASTLFINATSANGNTAGSGITVGAGAGAVVISAPIALTGSQTWASSSANGLTFLGGVTGTGSLTLQANSTGAITLSGTISVNNMGAIVNSGSGTGTTTISAPIGANITSVTENSATSALVLAGANVYTGGTVVSTGTLNANGSGALGAGTITVSGGVLNINSSGAAGTAGLLSVSGGQVNINAVGAFGKGGILLSSGQLNVNAASLGSSTLTITGGTISNTSGGPITVGTTNAETWSGSFTFGGNNSLGLGAGAVTFTTSPTITTNGVNTLTVGGAIGGGSFGLTKSGPGMLQLSGNNTYTGTTTVSQGTLAVNGNSVADATGYTLGDVNTGASNVALAVQSGFNSVNTALENNVTARLINVNVTSQGTGAATIDFSTNPTVNTLLDLTINRASTIKGPYSGLYANISGPGAGAGNTSLTLDVNGGTFVWTNGSLASATTPIANSFVGNVKIINSSATAGILQMQNLAYAAGTVTPNNPAFQNLMIPSSSSVTVASNVTWLITWGVQSIDGLNGLGTISLLSSTNNIAGPVLTVGANNGSGSYGGIIQDNTTQTTTLQPFIFGKTGTGTQVLTGANTYSGGTFVLNGVLQLGTLIGTTVGSLLSSSTVTLGNSATSSSGILQLGDASNPVNQTLGSIVIAGGSANAVVGGNSSPSILTINTTSTYAGALGGSGTNYNNIGIAVNTPASAMSPIVVTLSGTNTYTGPTLIQNGTLQAGSSTAFQGTSVVTLGSGTTAGTLDLNGFTVNVAGLATGNTNGPGLNIIGNSSSTNATLIFSSGTSTFGGTIQNTLSSGGSAQVALQVNSGSLTLRGTNTYTGATTINGGTLNLPAGVSLSSSPVTVNSTGTLTISGMTSSSSSVTLSSLTSSGGTLAFLLNTNNVVNSNPGILVSSSLTASGVTTINVSNTSPLAAGQYPLIQLSNTYSSSGTFTLNSASLGGRTVASLTYTGSPSSFTEMFLTVTTGGAVTWTNATASGNWGPPSPPAAGDGNWTFGGGATSFMSGDAVVLDNTPGTGTQTVTLAGTVGNPVNPASVTFNSTTTTYSLSGSPITNFSAGTPTTLSVLNGGAVFLNMANTYSGGTTILNGQLNINNASAIGTGPLTILGGAIDNTSSGAIALTTNNSENWNGSFSFGGTNSLNLGTGAVTLGQNGVTVTVNGNNPLTVGGAIGDGGLNYSLTVAGSGTLILTGNNTYSGTTTINSGTLQIGNGGSTGSLQTNIANSGSLVFDLSSTFIYGAGGNIISGSGSVTQAGAATLILAGPNSYSGSTFINAGIVNLAVANGSGVGPLGNGGTIVFGGGTLQFSSANQFDYSSRFSSAANEAFNIDTNGQSVTFASAITSAGATLTKLGAGTLILAGANSYTGNTFINAGILNAGSANGSGVGPFGNGGTIVFGGGTLQFSAANQFDYSPLFSTAANQPISVDTNGQTVKFAGNLTSVGGTLTVASSLAGGTLVLTGASTYSGGTTLSSGQLNINSSGTATGSPIGTGTFTILGGTIDNSSGAAVALATNNAMIWNASFAFGGSNPVNLGTGAVTLGANVTVTVNGSSSTNALTISGPIVSSLYGLTVAGTSTGTLILSGVNNVNGVTVNAGNLIVPNGSLTTTSMTLGNAATTNNATLSGGTINVNGTASFIIGNNATTLSTFTVSSGALNINTSGGFLVGNGTSAAITTVTGIFLQTGGTVNWSPTNSTPSNNFFLGNNSGTTFTVSGGTFTSSANSSGICVGTRGNTTFTVSGGGVFSEAFGFVSIGDGAVTTSTSSVTLGDGATFVGGTSILTGGTSGVLITEMIGKNIYAGGTTGTANLNFNGGTVRASQVNTTFINGLNAANVLSGGGIIDNNGFAITIPQALLTGASPDGGMVFMNSSATPAVTTLTGVSTYNGGTTILGGTTLAVGVSSALLSTGAITLNPSSGIATLSVLGSNVQPAASLTLEGAAGTTAQVTGTGTYQLTGGITFVGTNNPNGATISSTVDLNGAARTFTVGVTTASTVGLTVSGVVLDSKGGASLVKAGPGVLAFTNSNTYLGATTISAGTLQLSGGTTQGSPFTVSNGTVLAVLNSTATASAKLPSLTFGAVATDTTTLNLTAASDWSPSSPTLVVDTGALTTKGGAATTTINIASNSFLVSGNYNLISYGSTSGTGFSAFQLGTLPTYAVSAQLVNNTASSVIQLDVTAVYPFKWTGAVNNLWDVNANVNWVVNTTQTVYLQGHTTLFDDTAVGNTNLTLGVTVTPTLVTFANNALSYSVSGAGSIGGTGSVAISGGGNVTLATNNTYSGGTTLSNGTLYINAGGTSSLNSAIGTGALAISGGTIDSSKGGLLTLLTNNTQNWNGSFTFGGTNPLNLGSGAVTLGQSVTVTLNGTNSLTVGGAIGGQSQTYGLTVAGTGTLVLTGTSTYGGGTTISGGTLNINADSALGAAAGAVNLNGGTLQFAAAGGVALNSSRNIVLGGGAIDTNNGADTINGVISGPSSTNSNLIKNGAGILTLTNSNNYAGLTMVNAGTLYVASTSNLGGGALVVNNPNTTLPGTSTLLSLFNAGQTVGPLSGAIAQPANGNTAAIFLSSATTLTVNQTAPGTFQGTITGGGNLVLGASSASTLTLSGNSTYGGSTTINGGTIQLGVANALPATTSLSLGSGGTLNLNNNNQTIAALSSSAGNINTGTGTGGILTIGNTAGGTVTYNGVISGTGGLTWGIVNTNVANPTPSTLLLTNTSTNTGPMTINSGKLSIGTAYALSGGVAPVLPYSAAATYPGAFTLGPTATLLTNGFNLTIGSLGGGGPIGGNINLGNNSNSTLYIVQSLVQSASTGYAGVISGTGNVYIVNGVNLAVYGNWTLTGGVTHDVTTLGANHNDSPQSYLPFATSGSAVTTQGIEFAGFTDQVSTIYGGSAGDNNGKGTFVDATGDAGKLVLSYYAASVANGGPANGSGGTQNFSGFFANDVGLIFDAGYFGNAQQLTLSGPNNTTGPLTIGFTNQTTPQNGAATGAQSGVMNQIIISATSSFGAVTVGNIAVSNLINNLTVQPTGNLTAASVTIGDAFAGSTGNNSVTVGGTLTAGSVSIGNTSLYGTNVLTILSTGTVKASGAITIGNDFATPTGTLGTLNVNGALGTTSAPVTSLSVQAGGVLTGYGTINTATNPINVTNGTIRGGFDDGVNQLGTLSIAASSGTTAKPMLTIQGSGSSGLGQTGALMTEVLATSSTAATNSKINITGANNALSLNTTSGGGSGQINIVLYDPTASLTPGGPGGATYTFVLATVATAGRIQLGGTNQPAGTLLDNGTTLGAGSGNMGNADLYIVGASQTYMNSVTTWSLSIDTTGKQLMLSVTSATPEPEHILLMCVGVLLAGFAIRRRWQQRGRSAASVA